MPAFTTAAADKPLSVRWLSLAHALVFRTELFRLQFKAEELQNSSWCALQEFLLMIMPVAWPPNTQDVSEPYLRDDAAEPAMRHAARWVAAGGIFREDEDACLQNAGGDEGEDALLQNDLLEALGQSGGRAPAAAAAAPEGDGHADGAADDLRRSGSAYVLMLAWTRQPHAGSAFCTGNMWKLSFPLWRIDKRLRELLALRAARRALSPNSSDSAVLDGITAGLSIALLGRELSAAEWKAHQDLRDIKSRVHTAHAKVIEYKSKPQSAASAEGRKRNRQKTSGQQRTTAPAGAQAQGDNDHTGQAAQGHAPSSSATAPASWSDPQYVGHWPDQRPMLQHPGFMPEPQALRLGNVLSRLALMSDLVRNARWQLDSVWFEIEALREEAQTLLGQPGRHY